MWGGHTWRACGARAYNGDVGAEPQRGLGAEPPTLSSRVKTHWSCINLRNDVWQKWCGHVHPSAPRGDAPGHVYSCAATEHDSRDSNQIFLSDKDLQWLIVSYTAGQSLLSMISLLLPLYLIVLRSSMYSVCRDQSAISTTATTVRRSRQRSRTCATTTGRVTAPGRKTAFTTTRLGRASGSTAMGHAATAISADTRTRSSTMKRAHFLTWYDPPSPSYAT